MASRSSAGPQGNDSNNATSHNILVVSPIYSPDIGGPATYARGLVNNADALSIKVLAYSSQKQRSDEITLVCTQDWPVVRHVKFAWHLTRMASKSTHLYVLDPLVVGWITTIINTIFWKKPMTIRFVGDVNWELAYNTYTTDDHLDDYYSYKKHMLDLRYWIQRYVFAKATHLVTPSTYLATFLTKYYSITKSKISIVPNPVQTFGKTSRRENHRLLTIGRLVRTKQVHEVIQAVARAREERPWKLIVAGGGPELPYLQQLVDQLKAHDWVLFLGTLTENEVENEMRKATALVHYSIYEGQSHTLIKSLLAHTPIIASDIPANTELLGEAGNYVPLGDIDRLGEVINNPLKTARSIDTSIFSYRHHIDALAQIFINQTTRDE